MREYYITEGELHDLKYALRNDHKQMANEMLHEIEHRYYRLRLSQAEMILAYSGYYNSGG